MKTGLGLRVVTKVHRLPGELIEQFRAFGVANVGDAMGRFGVMDYRIKPVGKRGVKMVGSAITVRTRPGDNLMIHKALDMTEPGDVLVVDVQGSTQSGLWGSLMTGTALERGVAGLVVDGGVRDAADIRETGFPVFARAVIAAGGDKEGPGEVNVPISCGGVPVLPGDVIVGDDDGVVVIPQAYAAAVAEEVRKVLETEASKAKAIRAGTMDKSWIDKKLKEKGCVFE
jgi:RraA family protein